MSAAARTHVPDTDGLVHYRGFIADSARWWQFELRPSDVVITVPSKSGTTWMQTIVALLLFDGVPATPVNELSLWLDVNLRSDEETFARLAAQDHRRFIKTHVPLDGLPRHPEVTYVTVGRDPRDAFASMRKHDANLRADDLRARRTAAVGDADLAGLDNPWPETEDPHELATAFMELPRWRSPADVNLANVLHHLRLAWDARNDTHHPLFHYADLKSDLPGQMQRLRDALGVDLSDERVTELADLATLSAMRERAHTAAPEVDSGTWKDVTAFFRAGRHGDGAALMTPAQLERYEQRCEELHGDDPDFLDWVHHGSP